MVEGKKKQQKTFTFMVNKKTGGIHLVNEVHSSTFPISGPTIEDLRGDVIYHNC